MDKLQTISARIIINSKGLYTIEAQAHFISSHILKASIPMGTSTGSKEAHYIDNSKAIQFILEHSNTIVNLINNNNDIKELHKFLKKQDNTTYKSKIGANTFLVLEILYTKIMAYLKEIPLYTYINTEFFNYIQEQKGFPTPLFNIINGGLHAKNGLAFQEFWVIPRKFKNITEKINAGVQIYNTLKGLLKKKGYSTLTGLEGGFAPTLKNGVYEALDLISESVYKAGYSLGDQIMLGTDAAATDFVINQNNEMLYPVEPNKPPLSYEGYLKFWSNLVTNYPILLAEDPLPENAPLSLWSELRSILSLNYVSLIGDDLTVTNSFIVQNAINHQAIDGSIVKPNQIGSIIETMDTIKTLKDNHAISIISHRSGETNDDFIADLAVATSANYIKTGAPAHGERVAKYNRLLEIALESI